MSSSREIRPEFFKIVRAGVEPISPETYHALYTAAAGMVLRSRTEVYYTSGTKPGRASQLSAEYTILEEQAATAWLDDGGRMVGASVFTDESLTKRMYGIEADAAVAPKVGAAPKPLFELSTDGLLYWVTDCDSIRTATPDEIDLLIDGLEAA